MLNLKRFAIFSLKGLDLQGNTVLSPDYPVNYRLEHIKAILKSRGIDFKVVKGSYKGTFETSIMAIVDDDQKLDFIRHTAFEDGQESILIVNEDRRAYLQYNADKSIQSIGDFEHVTAETAQGLDNWTLDGTDYYACI